MYRLYRPFVYAAVLAAALLLSPGRALAFDKGDLNCDGSVDAFDIDHFVQALTDPAGYAADHDGDPYPPCDITLADINGDGKVDVFDIDPFVALLTGGPTSPTETQLAGNPLAQYPYFEYVKAFNLNKEIRVALDPTRFPAIVGETADIYVVANKTAAQWAADPTLTDVTPGGALTVTFVGGTIQANTFTPVNPYDLSASAGTGIGVPYDVVVDINQNGTLDGGDYIDGGADLGGLYVIHDLTWGGTKTSPAGGPLAVTEIIYSGGSWLGQDTYYPTSIASLGKLPLIVVSHGNGHTYLMYDQIGYHMASYGYIVMAHQNETSPGIETASTTTLKNTDYIIGAQATIAGGVLNGHIDSHRITWIGHSRGGEGITRAYDRVYDSTFVPTNYVLSDLWLLSSMAPTDFLGTAQSNPHAVKGYHLWTASGDADVSGVPNNDIAQTFHLHERAEKSRHSTILQGVGHGDLHDGGGSSVFTGPCPIGRANTHQIQRGFFLPLIKYYIEGNYPATDLLWRQWESFKPIGAPSLFCAVTGGDAVVVCNTWRNRYAGTYWVIDDYETQTSLSVSSSGGAVTYTVTNVLEDRLDDKDSSFDWFVSDPMNGFTYGRVTDITRGVVFDWSGSDKYYEWAIVAASQDFTKWDRLSFRTAQQTRHPNTIVTIADLTYTVTLRDAGGKTSSINIGAYGGGVEEPYQRTGAGTGTGWHAEFETIRMRLTDFLNNGSGIDLTKIVAVRLNFGPSWGEAQGRIGVDTVELVTD